MMSNDNTLLMDTVSKSTTSVNPEKSQIQRKKRNRTKKSNNLTVPSSSTEITIIQSLPSKQLNNEIVNNKENLQDLSSSEVATVVLNKNKKKRKKKKTNTAINNNNITESETKVENLLSKTFQDSRRSSSDSTKNFNQEEQKQQISFSNESTIVKIPSNNNQNNHTENSNMNKTKIIRTSSEKFKNERHKLVNNAVTHEKKSKTVNDQKASALASTSTSTSTSTSSNERLYGKITTQQKVKRLPEKSVKNKNAVTESNKTITNHNDPKINDNSTEKKQSNKTITNHNDPKINDNSIEKKQSNKTITNHNDPKINDNSTEKKQLNSVKQNSVAELTTIKEQKHENKIRNSIESVNENKTSSVNVVSTELSSSETSIKKIVKSREQILAEREAKRLAKQAAKNKNKDPSILEGKSDTLIAKISENKSEEKVSIKVIQVQSTETSENAEIKKKSPTTKAERRAIQEAQRQAKLKLLAEKQKHQQHQDQQQKDITQQKLDTETNQYKNKCISVTAVKSKKSDYRIKLFNHLYSIVKEKNLFVNNPNIHPAMVRLGEQYIKRVVVGSNARCIAFLNALKIVISEFETPPKKEFNRVLEANIKNCIDYLHKCRPLAVSIINAHKYIKIFLTQLPTDLPESKLKENLLQCIDDYIKDQIEKAAQAINGSVQEKISNGDVILTYGCSSLISHILEEALHRNVSFRVICVDSRPFMEGQEMLRYLVSSGISCTCVLINAVGFIMPEVTKVLLGAHSILANGYVMSRAGTAQVALVARSYNVPVLVCCETHKFSERVQTDAIVYNELGNPDDVVSSSYQRYKFVQHNNEQQQKNLKYWRMFKKLIPLNLNYDITPPELITAVVTEVAILPCTSVPVILRIKPTEIGG